MKKKSASLVILWTQIKSQHSRKLRQKQTEQKTKTHNISKEANEDVEESETFSLLQVC